MIQASKTKTKTSLSKYVGRGKLWKKSELYVTRDVEMKDGIEKAELFEVKSERQRELHEIFSSIDKFK